MGENQGLYLVETEDDVDKTMYVGWPEVTMCFHPICFKSLFEEEEEDQLPAKDCLCQAENHTTITTAVDPYHRLYFSNPEPLTIHGPIPAQANVVVHSHGPPCADILEGAFVTSLSPTDPQPPLLPLSDTGIRSSVPATVFVRPDGSYLISGNLPSPGTYELQVTSLGSSSVGGCSNSIVVIVD